LIRGDTPSIAGHRRNAPAARFVGDFDRYRPAIGNDCRNILAREPGERPTGSIIPSSSAGGRGMVRPRLGSAGERFERQWLAGQCAEMRVDEFGRLTTIRKLLVAEDTLEKTEIGRKA